MAHGTPTPLDAGASVAGAHPEGMPQRFYQQQRLSEGLHYLTMRDGVQIAATVRLPYGKTLADGPFPTVIEYSGYQTAAPHDLLLGAAQQGLLTRPDPLAPATSTLLGGAVAPLIGFAAVSVQMRGTGCSGGAFDLFDLPTTYDAYDAIETVAAQPWVANHKVGMVGISYSGISQIFAAGAQPPSLAAIAPLSITDDLYSTGYPGGIFNAGFARTWIDERIHDARPAPAGGQPYAVELSTRGDETCRRNQIQHREAVDLDTLIKGNPQRTPSVFDPRSPQSWASRITVPVFLSGALQDEQTGSQWTNIIPALRDNPNVWVTMVNGTHMDSLGPKIISRLIEFLNIFVAQRVPQGDSVLRLASSTLYRQITKAGSGPIPPVRFTTARSVGAAREKFRTDPRIRVLFDNGAGPAGVGAMDAPWEAGFNRWPPTGDIGDRLFLNTGGRLTPDVPSSSSTVSFRPDPSARPSTTLPAGVASSRSDAWVALPDYRWEPVHGSAGVGFVSGPLPVDHVVVGPASVEVELASTARTTDIQATLTEVHPDGTETYITSGELRSGFRNTLTSGSTRLTPVYDFRTLRPLEPGRAESMRIPLGPIAHAFRTGARIRVTVEAVGGDRPIWAFDTPRTGGTVTDTITLGSQSSIVLPVVHGLAAAGDTPPCPSLRGQPCRRYLPAGNGG